MKQPFLCQHSGNWGLFSSKFSAQSTGEEGVATRQSCSKSKFLDLWQKGKGQLYKINDLLYISVWCDLQNTPGKILANLKNIPEKS